MELAELARQQCSTLSGSGHRLDEARAAQLLALLPGWSRVDQRIEKEFRFRDYNATMAFANGVAWLAQRQNHHPDMTVGYNRCRVAYSTHDVGGLSMNDFISAAKIEALAAI